MPKARPIVRSAKNHCIQESSIRLKSLRLANAVIQGPERDSMFEEEAAARLARVVAAAAAMKPTKITRGVDDDVRLTRSTQRVQTSANDFHVLFLAVYRNRNSKERIQIVIPGLGLGLALLLGLKLGS